MAKYLIVNADDYGMCNSANEAVEELFQNGRLKSATIMMPCVTAEHAVKFSIDNPQYAIGVHLTLTSEWQKYRWKPLTDGKSLLDSEGFMWHESDDVGKHATYEDLEAEVRAQIDLAHKMGMKPSHLDNHMGSLYGHEVMPPRIGLLKMTLRICGDYGYAFRMFSSTDKRTCPRGVPYRIYSCLKYFSRHWSKKYNVILPDYLIFPDWTEDLKQSYEHYREEILKIWTDIPDGVTETFVHPAKASDELRGITNSWRFRDWEYQLLNDPETEKYLNDHGVEMISYRELIKLKGGKVK